MRDISDTRYLGLLDNPPERFVRMDGAMCCPKGTEIWTNGKSIFSEDFRWCHVTKEVTQ